MPWQESTVEQLRVEGCALASGEGSNVSELCRRFGISRKSGVKWLHRYRAEGVAGLHDRDRRPHTCPHQSAPALEAAILAIRDQHPTWGGRKLRRRLQDLGTPGVPAASTITAILRRHDRLDPILAAAHTPCQRFTAPAPNDLWQIDCTGHFPLHVGRCHPLPVLDDHSRFLLGLQACANEHSGTVQAVLTTVFRRYGLPWRLLCDNGAPWGTLQTEHHLTVLTAWLLRLGITVVPGRPFHPQTQGKLERANRTLGAEVLATGRFATLTAAQTAFDAWRSTYNQERPHDALHLATPARLYRPRPRAFPETLPPISYDLGDHLRAVDGDGRIAFAGRRWRISHALVGLPVAVRPSPTDGLLEVRFCHQLVRHLDRRAPGPTP